MDKRGFLAIFVLVSASIGPARAARSSESVRSTISGLCRPRFIKRCIAKMTSTNIIRLSLPLNRFLIRLMLSPAFKIFFRICIVARNRLNETAEENIRSGCIKITDRRYMGERSVILMWR